MTTINLAESQNLPIRQTKIRPPGLLRQDTKLAGLIKKPSLRLCGRRQASVTKLALRIELAENTKPAKNKTLCVLRD